jgi:hypothetical protein
MSNALPSLADLVASSGAAAPSFFTKESKVGDSITGQVLDVQTRQHRDPQTNKLGVWEGGDPMLQIVVTIQTELHDGADDDGVRSVFIKWWGRQRSALLEALNDSGQDNLTVGQEFTATLSGTEKNANKALSDTKLYTYKIG